MNDPFIDLTGDDKPATAMDIDDINPFLQPAAPRDPSSSTAAPFLGPHVATAPAPVASTIPPTSLDTAANEALRQSQRAKQPSRQRMLMDQIGEQPQHLRMHRKHGKFSVQEMQDHLRTISIGLRPTDPTVTELPDELPAPIHPANSPSNSTNVEVINLNEWTQERLNALAATTAPTDPFSTLLEFAPPAPKDRLGRFTGQQNQEKIKETATKQYPSAEHVNIVKDVEKKREKKVVKVSVAAPPAATLTAAAPLPAAAPAPPQYTREDMITTLHKYLSIGVDVPWPLLGRQNALKANGTDVLVLPLWTAVIKFGGFGQVSKNKLWSAVGRELGFDTRTFHNPQVLKDAYAKYLLPYEVFLKHSKQQDQQAAGPVDGGGGGSSNYFIGS